MSDDRLDERLQDYLDDRLSGPERAAFEKRLENDPDLASRLEACRSIGRALREISDDLPPGFYARARERFETARPQRSGWRFLLRWEAIGAAAAGLLLVAVMLPDILRGDRQDLGAPTPAPVRESVPAKTPPAVEDEPAKPQEKTLQGPGVEAGKDAPLDKRGERRREGAEAVGDAAAGAEEPLERLEVQDALTEESFAPAPPPPDAAAVDDDETGAGQNVLERDAAAGAMRKNEKADAKKAARPDATAAAAPAVPEAPDAEREQDEAEGYYGGLSQPRESAVGSVPLTGTGMKAGSVIVVEDGAAWNDLPAGVRGAVSLPDFPKQRLVLIGPREGPVLCASIEVAGEADRVLIRVPRAVAGPGDEACAVTVPADGRRVEVVDVPGTDR
jgi:hypothetical protein